MKRQQIILISVFLALLTLTGANIQQLTQLRKSANLLRSRSHPVVGLAAGWGQMPLVFIANQGQLDARVAYYVQGRDKTLYFTAEGVTLALAGSPAGEGKGRWIARLDFVGANAVQPTGLEQTETVVSYFKGSPGHWHTGLPTYATIAYANLWPGIDLAYSGTMNQLKYEFVVAPGADPTRIRLAYHGATVRLDETGWLEVTTPAGSFTDAAPIAYQEVDGQRIPVTVSYALQEDATYGFQLGAYDPAVPLVIDPVVLIYCGYIGGSKLDGGKSIVLDTNGYAYLTGYTYSSETSFPVAVGPDLTFNEGNEDAFVAKVKADGSGLVYAGFIGGSNYDEGWGIAVDAAGFAYVTGGTGSSQATFPVLLGPDLTYNGGGDAFVAKINQEGTGLVYAGYIGGSGADGSEKIAVDALGNAYVVGGTESNQATFPVLNGPDLTFNGGFHDVFVAKVKADGTGLVYAGYIGGNSNTDYGRDIFVDGIGNAYVVGYTGSTEATFPVSVGPDLTYNGGNWDVFVAKVATDGSGLLYSGYIGGSDSDEGYSIVVDALGYAYITGLTYSSETTFPVSGGPDLTYNGSGDAFVAKIAVDGGGLVYAGYIGGQGNDIGYGIALDRAGCLYVAGDTESTGATFPVTIGPDLTHNGKKDVFVAKVQPNAQALLYAGFLGGEQNDLGRDIAVDAAGNAYITGETLSNQSTFPVTAGPDLTYNSSTDAFVAKVSPGPTPPDTFPPVLPADPLTGSPLITPTLGITVQTPRPWFDWTDGVDDVGVVSYTLVITGPVGQLRTPAVLPVHQVSVAVSEYQPTWNLPDGEYRWVVRAHDAVGNPSDWTEPQTFFVEAMIFRLYLPLVARR